MKQASGKSRAVPKRVHTSDTFALVLALAVFLAAGVAFSVATYWKRHRERLASIDRELSIQAEAINHLLPADFHDRAIRPGAISPEEDRANIRKLSQHCTANQFAFLYTLVQINDEIFITASSASPEELKSGTEVTYFHPFPEANEQFHLAFRDHVPLSFTHRDRWGVFRAAIIPQTSPSGQSYLSVAEYDISHVRSSLRRATARDLLMCGFLLLAALPLVYIVLLHERRAAAELLKFQEGRERVARLEALGNLAGGVAHDFNNLLMGIMNYVQLCRDEIAADHPIQRWLVQITREAERSAAIVRQLLAVSRKQAIAPRELDLRETVPEMLDTLRRLIGEDIEIVWEPGERPACVNMDQGQVHQILVNLCINARDAIGGVGKITIESDAVDISDEYNASHADAESGEFAVLAVSDDGCGMDFDTRTRIFDPFFTTKSAGEGTGLGLATVYGIVKQNGGFINVYSELDEGTTFRVYLPRIDCAVVVPRQPSSTVEVQGGSETILLVEDERSIRRTVSLFLEKAGYVVFAVGAPEEALQVASEHGDRLDLLVTDVVLPGMNGRDLAEELRAGHADLRVLYMSGYTSNVIAQRGIIEEGVEFLAKPVGREELLSRVREVLNKKKTTQ